MTNTVNTRALVLEMLMAINEDGQYSHLVLRDVLDKYQYLSKQERAFLTRLTEGTVEKQITLDYVIDHFSKTKVRKMKPLIRNLMRLSVYQIMYMDGVPDSAVCNEAVKLARKRGFSGLSGFVNGVLRSIAREWKTVGFPNASVCYSVPEWIVNTWQKDYGKEQTTQILEAPFEREGADRLFLLGDLLYHGPRNDLPREYAPKEVIPLLNGKKEKLLCVRGNCDAEVDQMVLEFPVLADYAVLPVGRRLIYATHGHIYHVKNLPPLAPGDVLLHGHTHVPAWTEFGQGNLYLNPGSVSIPKEDSPHSYMTLEGNTMQWKELESSAVFHELTL